MRGGGEQLCRAEESRDKRIKQGSKASSVFPARAYE